MKDSSRSQEVDSVRPPAAQVSTYYSVTLDPKAALLRVNDCSRITAGNGCEELLR